MAAVPPRSVASRGWPRGRGTWAAHDEFSRTLVSLGRASTQAGGAFGARSRESWHRRRVDHEDHGVREHRRESRQGTGRGVRSVPKELATALAASLALVACASSQSAQLRALGGVLRTTAGAPIELRSAVDAGRIALCHSERPVQVAIEPGGVHRARHEPADFADVHRSALRSHDLVAMSGQPSPFDGHPRAANLADRPGHDEVPGLQGKRGTACCSLNEIRKQLAIVTPEIRSNRSSMQHLRPVASGTAVVRGLPSGASAERRGDVRARLADPKSRSTTRPGTRRT